MLKKKDKKKDKKGLKLLEKGIINFAKSAINTINRPDGSIQF